MTHRNDEPRHHPAWRALLVSLLMLAAGTCIVLGVYCGLVGNPVDGIYFLGAAVALSAIAFPFSVKR